MTDSSRKVPRNGKVFVTEAKLNESIERLEGKIDKIADTLGHINVILSERLSNHAARLQGLERAAGSRRGEEF